MKKEKREHVGTRTIKRSRKGETTIKSVRNQYFRVVVPTFTPRPCSTGLKLSLETMKERYFGRVRILNWRYTKVKEW